jgi:HlyD family secretion protein
MTRAPATTALTRFDRLVGGRRREAGMATAGVIVIALVGASIGLRRADGDWPSTTARIEPFVESLVEVGTISAQRLMLYSSTIPGAQAKIVEIAPEGHAAAPGDVLVRFDTALFEQNRERERAALRQAEAELVRAREEARVELLRGAGALDDAQQQIGYAERGLVNELEGRGKVEIIEAETAAAEAERELQQARATYEDIKPLLLQSVITKAEFDRAEQALRRAEDLRRLAVARREALIKYERPAATSRAQSEVNAARDGFARQVETVTARTTERQAAIALARSRVEEITARLDILETQIARATIRAQGPGLVVYRDLYFGSDRRKPQVGDEVFPNQPIIALPDSSQLTVDTRIREIDLHKVSASQRVEVRVDAYPDLRLPASVALVGALAQEDAARAGTKFFPVTVKLLATDARLRTGMTARVEIEVSSLPAAVVVPLQAVFEERGRRYVVTLAGGQPRRQPVTLAAENESLAAVSAGLASGEHVLLVDPTAPSK